MKTVKPSIAIQRQIPQHVRENYPLFVDFLKAYYEFLEDTQQVELEKIRDIDTSLDEFIQQFRGEIANGIPLERAQDKRMLIRHLREFYLSRGSEASYQFLFKVLFNQDAELYYPSTQILRASDGKWKQDVSIFVEVDAGFPAMFPLSGNFVTISTTRTVAGRQITKRLTTHIERVTEYTVGVYELFIPREYVNEIDVGSIVEFTDVNEVEYRGSVLPCPTKVSVFKGGKGFKVGQIFALSTDIGRGCIVKVTKVGSEGEIINISLMTVGLDYVTKFYSYLSSKTFEAQEYVHPLKLNTPYNPADPAYNERSGGFVDSGYVSKQTYFAYSTTIPVGVTGKESDRFFADTSYVGDVVSQFYTDNSGQEIDADIAVIEISLGSVAKYPGYYMSQDGFISDEIYIQDGNYYQAFSYVVKVEEELRNYATILKKILHPAGMKFFAEYTINTTIAFEPVVEIVKNLIEQVDPASPLDQALGYSAYILDDSQLPDIVYIPAPDALEVRGKFGKASLLPVKSLSDNVTIVVSTLLQISQNKFAYDTFEVNDEEKVSFTKRLRELMRATDVRAKTVFKNFDDAITLTDSLKTAKPEAELNDSISITESQLKGPTKFIEDDAYVSDAYLLSSTKAANDLINIASVGYLALNGYDAECYYDRPDQYQQDTVI
jgi:hypothetical protein